MKSPKVIDPLDVIERAYALELPEREWLAGILEHVAPAVDAGQGLMAYLYDAAARPLRVWNFVGEFAPTKKEVVDVITSADDEYVAQSYLVTPFATASERPGFDRQRTFGRRLHKYGIKDAVALNAFDPSGLGAWIGALLPEKRTVTDEERERWARVSMHVGAALRLRRRLHTRGKKTRSADSAERTSTSTSTPDAIFSVSGKLEHTIDGIASERTNLVEAVRRLDRARGRLRKSDPDAAVDAWKVLVRARWSLVDQFESDGRRYVLAYNNAPLASAGPDAFTDREREVVAQVLLGHSPKLIAYALGLAPSTVRVHLTNASKKLGVRTRPELIAKYRDWLFQQAPSS